MDKAAICIFGHSHKGNQLLGFSRCHRPEDKPCLCGLEKHPAPVGTEEEETERCVVAMLRRLERRNIDNCQCSLHEDDE